MKKDQFLVQTFLLDTSAKKNQKSKQAGNIFPDPKKIAGPADLR